MGLRTKIAAIFVPLLLLAVLAVSATEANHAVGVMVEDLGDSGNVLVNETFEQIRTALALSQGDPVVAHRRGRLRSLSGRPRDGHRLCGFVRCGASTSTRSALQSKSIGGRSRSSRS